MQNKKDNPSCLSPPEEQRNLLRHYHATGDFAKAKKLSRSLIKNYPNYIFAYKILGDIFEKTGMNFKSLEMRKKALQLAPTDYENNYNIANTYRALCNFEEAEKYYKKTIYLQPSYVNAHNNLGNMFLEQKKFDEAEQQFKLAIESDKDHFLAFNNLSIFYRNFGLLSKSKALLKEANRIEPNNAFVINNLGLLDQDIGDIQGAKHHFENAIKIKPDFSAAHLNYSLIKKFKSDDEYLSELKEVYKKFEDENESKCQICFAIAKAYEDLYDYENAYIFIKKANSIKESLVKYSFLNEVRLHDKIIKNAKAVETFTKIIYPQSNEISPIFIVGMPRSGTTLIEQILSSHNQVSAGGEQIFIDHFGGSIADGSVAINSNRILEFRNSYLSKLQPFTKGNNIVVDKMPLNFRYIGLIAVAFPKAKIIHVTRDPKAVCWSNFKRYFPGGAMGYSYNISDTIEYYSLYQKMMYFWHDTIGEKIYDLDYDLLTSNQVQETHKLISCIGLDWDDNCLFPEKNTGFVKTASSTQVRVPVYRDSSEEWRAYQKFMDERFEAFFF